MYRFPHNCWMHIYVAAKVLIKRIELESQKDNTIMSSYSVKLHKRNMVKLINIKTHYLRNKFHNLSTGYITKNNCLTNFNC